jgi:transcriptional regulator GlxA family with amidase domain
MDIRHHTLYHAGMQHSQTRSIALLVYDDFGFLDVVGPADVFTIANQRAGKALYTLQIVTVGRRRYVRAESGMRLMVDADTHTIKQVHTLLVTGGQGCFNALAYRDTTAELQRLTKSASRIVSVCTGSFLLAEAGLLDGERATTHWAWAEELASRYPQVNVVKDELYVRSGRIVTAAGIAAGIDLALALVAEDHGEQLARMTSQRMVLYLNRMGGQSQFSERLSAPKVPTDRFEEVLADVAAHPAIRCSASILAERLDISERHLARLFRSRLQTTPARWVERVRVDSAREFLEMTDDTLESIAERCGFGSTSTLRQAFHRVLGLSPNQYRQTHQLQGYH